MPKPCAPRRAIACPIRRDFAQELAASQGDKIVASSNAEFGEVRFDYPDRRDGYENSRYLAVAVSGPDAGSWHRGVMARTAFVDAGPSAYPIGAAYDGAVFLQEKGRSADGGAPADFFSALEQGQIVMAGTAGNCTVQFAQQTSNANQTIFRAQSRLLYRRIA